MNNSFVSKGDRVVFTYDGQVRKGVVESYVEHVGTGKRTLTIKDETREGNFRSFKREKCEGLVNLSKVPS